MWGGGDITTNFISIQTFMLTKEEDDTGRWRKKRKREFIFFFKCEMLNIQFLKERVLTGKQLYLNPLLLWACSTHGLTSPLAFQKRRETFPLLLGTYGHIWTVSEAAGCAETWPNCFPSVSPQCFQGDSAENEWDFEHMMRSTKSLHFCPHILPLFHSELNFSIPTRKKPLPKS